MANLPFCVFNMLIIAAVVVVASSSSSDDEKFSTVISAIADKRAEISQHQFFKMLADSSLAPQKRMSFIPYWTYFAMTFADLLDTWLYIENPQNELEERINTFVGEDNFHYNLFLHDVEEVFGYTPDCFGSYTAVMRHIWGDETRNLRRLMYTWAHCAKKYNDPLVTLATFEAIEAGLKDIFEVTFTHLYLKGGDKLNNMKYFGLTHVELEINHTQTAWFREGDTPVRPLGELDISPLQKEQVMEVVDQIFDQ